MAVAVKCNNCNIVIDEMLSYLQNKVSVADEETLVRICTTSFSSEEIKSSKSLLFESVPTNARKILRKNRGKEQRDVADIISIFKSTEPDVIPIFVARDLHKLPPILFDHLDCSKLLKDIMTMKAEIDLIKATFATQDSVNELKADFRRIKTDSLPPASAFKVNTKRGAWLDSGPMGLSHDEYNNKNCNKEWETQSVTECLNAASPALQYRSMRVSEHNQSRQHLILQQSSLEGVLASPANAGEERVTSVSEEESGTGVNAAMSSSTMVKTDQSTAAVVTDVRKVALAHEPESSPNKMGKDRKSENGWVDVTSRKKQRKYRFAGKSGIARDLECTFKAADTKTPMFITNVHLSAKEKDIVDYIYKKTKEVVHLESINMKLERGHKAYKFLISESNLSIYMDETMWPAGVIFRRFVNFKQRKTHRDGPNKP